MTEKRESSESVSDMTTENIKESIKYYERELFLVESYIIRLSNLMGPNTAKLAEFNKFICEYSLVGLKAELEKRKE